jgi:hypothetical protein
MSVLLYLLYMFRSPVISFFISHVSVCGSPVFLYIFCVRVWIYLKSPYLLRLRAMISCVCELPSLVNLLRFRKGEGEEEWG